jgi:hypothetical protein
MTWMHGIQVLSRLVVQGEEKDTEGMQAGIGSKPMFEQASMDGWAPHVSNMNRNGVSTGCSNRVASSYDQERAYPQFPL